MIKLINGDCLTEMKNIDENSIDLVFTDLPYGQTDLDWDIKIDLKQMWKLFKKICKLNCLYVFTTTTKFGYELIKSNPSWFMYDLVWEKSSMVGFLNAKKQPLRKHEMIYVFGNKKPDDIHLERNIFLREYAKKMKKFINLKPIEIKNILNRRSESFLFKCNSTQFGLPTKTTWDDMIKYFNIDKMDNYLSFEECKKKFEQPNKKTYNHGIETYEIEYSDKIINKKTIYGKHKNKKNSIFRGYPSSILKFKLDKKKYHPTQKPIELCEWIIKTYSNENDNVLDICMGSGSAGVACNLLNRNFIGIEMDENYFNICKERIFL